MGAETRRFDASLAAERLHGKAVFISGPMTGIVHYNAPAFAEAHALCREAGAEQVFDPAYRWLMERPYGEGAPEKTHEDYMRECINELTRERFGRGPAYDVLLQLGGWRDSDGACCEYMVATRIGVTPLELSELVAGDGK